MLGSALKLSVQSSVLDKNSTDFYFPEGTWCDVFRNSTTSSCMTVAAGGETKPLSTLAYEFYLHLRAGYIVPMQDGVNQNKFLNITTTTAQQSEPIDLYVLPNCNATFCVSSGSYINDNGEDLDLTNNVNQYDVSYSQDISIPSVLTINIAHSLNATNYLK
jgi:alpha-glucosidase (family GH31 glycosyl hydrolase)